MPTAKDKIIITQQLQNSNFNPFVIIEVDLTADIKTGVDKGKNKSTLKTSPIFDLNPNPPTKTPKVDIAQLIDNTRRQNFQFVIIGKSKNK